MGSMGISPRHRDRSHVGLFAIDMQGRTPGSFKVILGGNDCWLLAVAKKSPTGKGQKPEYP